MNREHPRDNLTLSKLSTTSFILTDNDDDDDHYNSYQDGPHLQRRDGAAYSVPHISTTVKNIYFLNCI